MEKALVWMLRRLSGWPLGWLQAVGSVMGWLAWLGSPTYRRRFQHNVRLAGLSPRAMRPAIAHAGRMVGEAPWLWLRPASALLGERVRWEGGEHVEAALASGRGLLFLTPHLGSFEVTAQAYAERYGVDQPGRAGRPVTVLYRPARQPWLHQLMDEARQRPGMRAVPTTLSGVRQMIRALRQGEAVGLLPDQVPPEGLGVWAPFFGKPAYTMTLAARLAQQTGAQVLLIYAERLPRGRGYHVVVRPAQHGWLQDADAQSAAEQVNQAMETLIRQCPQQYLWGYNRYRTPRDIGLGASASRAEG